LRLITATTRPKRDTEVDGVDYSFLNQEEFDILRDTNQLLEHADVYGYSYGSPRKFVDEKRAEGFDVILKLDVQGGLSVKEAMPDAVMVFLAPPSMEELERRLRGRRTESPEQFAKRLGNALAEIKLIPHYDYLIVHDTPEQACEELGAIIQAERLKVAKNG
jgi:guanylate kinase